jgi:hypothetical protein
MPFKLNRYHKDYLYWLWPIIFMGLALITSKLDRQNNESGTSTDVNVNIDSSLTISAQTILTDSLRIRKYNDSILLFYATFK